MDVKRKSLGENLQGFAVRTGLEPATPGVTGRYSNQLNYRTICSDFMRFCRTRMQRYIFFSYFQTILHFFDELRHILHKIPRRVNSLRGLSF